MAPPPGAAIPPATRMAFIPVCPWPAIFTTLTITLPTAFSLATAWATGTSASAGDGVVIMATVGDGIPGIAEAGADITAPAGDGAATGTLMAFVASMTPIVAAIIITPVVQPAIATMDTGLPPALLPGRKHAAKEAMS